MSKLQEAISSVMLHASSVHRMRDFEPELRLMIHASRAMACEECKGTGKVSRPIIKYALSADDTFKMIDCNCCLADRKEIGIYGH